MKVFPNLIDDNWSATRNGLQCYSQVVGAIREAWAPKQKHWWHIGLLPHIHGLTTGTLGRGDEAFKCDVNFNDPSLRIEFVNGEVNTLRLIGQSKKEVWEELLRSVPHVARNVKAPDSEGDDNEHPGFSPDIVSKLGRVFRGVSSLFEVFKGEQRGETGPILLWPHHFDLAMLLFSGKKVEGVDPNDEEKGDEQMNFGLATGDSIIPNPYFYITSYPFPDRLKVSSMPEGAHWHSEGWEGAVMPYETLREVVNPDEHLLSFLRHFKEAHGDMP